MDPDFRIRRSRVAGCHFSTANRPTLLHQVSFNHHQSCSSPISIPTSEFQSKTSITLTRTFRSFRCCNSINSTSKTGILNAFKQSSVSPSDDSVDIIHVLKRWGNLTREVFPGGNWWRLPDVEREDDSSSVEAKPITVLKALSQIWTLISDQTWILCAAICALTVAAISEISLPGIITASVFAAQNGETWTFYCNLQLLLLLCLISGVCSGLRSGCFAVANVILVKRLRETVFNSLLLQDMSFFDSEAVGDLTSRIGADCQRLSHTIGNDIHLILRSFLQGSGAFVNLMALSWPLALSSLIICFILSAIFLVYGRYQKKTAMLAQDFTSSANEVARETLSSIRTVRAYGIEGEEYQRCAQWLDRLASVGMRESVAYGLWNLSFNVLYRWTQVFAVLLGGMSILVGHVSAEQLTKYVLYCEWLIYAAWRMQGNMSSLIQSVGACEKVLNMMHHPPSHPFLSEGVKLQGKIECIEFADVSFHYPTRKMVPVLEKVNFCIQSNEVVAIVGASGSGKSTLINLLIGLYEPISGEIYINGIPLRRMDIRWLREKIGFVGQEPHLFHMDVKSNISYGCSRSIKQENVESAAMNAYAHEFISDLPDGYDTIIDQNLLSGGQKQRIAIARALLRDPEIMILDEATSALDAESAGHIKEALLSLKNGSKKRTVIIIAQRFSTVKAADRILVMDHGQVVEIGNHRELIHKNGLYARLFKKQTDTTLSSTQAID